MHGCIAWGFGVAGWALTTEKFAWGQLIDAMGMRHLDSTEARIFLTSAKSGYI